MSLKSNVRMHPKPAVLVNHAPEDLAVDLWKFW
jgi:hypothetical protein